MFKISKPVKTRLFQLFGLRNRLWSFLIEIAMVTLGILIALSINNWNADRKMRNQEATYLQGVRADLKEDIKDLKAMADMRKQMAEGAVELLKMRIPSSKQEVRDFNLLVNTVYSWHAFQPNNNTFRELVSVGRLSSIQNSAIINLLLVVDQDHSKIANTREHMLREYEEYLYDVATKQRVLFPYVDFEKLVLTDTFRYNKSPLRADNNTLKDDASFLLTNLTARNGLKLAIFNNHQLKIHCLELIEKEEYLLEVIEDELGN